MLVFISNHNMCLVENDALQLAVSKKESSTLISWPPKGNSRKGFKLQVVMGLEDNDELYATLCVSTLYLSRILSNCL
jgi:hypothetical protein